MQTLLLLVFGAASCLGAVRSEDITLRDGKRGKDLECLVHYPATGDQLPLIVFSHGFGADKAAFSVISRHVAAHGYVVIHPSHTDGFGRSANRQAEEPGGLRAIRAGGGLASLLEDPAKIEGRVADVAAVLDSTAQLLAKLPELKGRLDPSRIGVGGHSYGAYTSMLIGGVTVDIGGARARSFADPRVRCVLPISAQGTGQQGLTGSSWSALRLPMMTVTGSQDRGAAGQGPSWKEEPFRLSPSGDKYLVLIEGANHMSFGGGLGERSSGTTEVVKAATLAFWNAYLKDDEKAKAGLRSGEVVKPFAGMARIESK